MRRGFQLPDRLRQVVIEEFRSIRPFMRMMRLVTLMVPINAGFRTRTMLIRLTGWNVHRSTIFSRAPLWSGLGPIRSRLQIGSGCYINVGCHFELNDHILIGDNVAIGHDVLILTSTHQIGTPARRAGSLTTAPVEIGSGAWIGARSVLLPGITIGAGAIVGAGSVVKADVLANSVVAGVPAKVVRDLTDGPPAPLAAPSCQPGT